MAYSEITKEEQSVINALERLGKRWPKSLWLFSGNGSLYVMKTPENGNEMLPGAMPLGGGGGVDPENVVTVIPGIRNDGGDW